MTTLVNPPAGPQSQAPADDTHLKVQHVVLWFTPAIAAVLLALFVAFPGFFPPMSPTDSAAETARFYQDNTGMIRLSMVGFNLFGIMIVPFFVLIMAQMQRMKGQSHIFAFSYLASVVGGATLFALSSYFFAMAAFRPDRGDDLIQLYNDLAWIFFIAPVGMLVAQFLLLATAIFFDDKVHPVFPRWVAWYSIATAVVMAPAAAAAVYQTGPFAWDGIVSFWLRNGALALFVIVMFFALKETLKRQADEARLGA